MLTLRASLGCVGYRLRRVAQRVVEVVAGGKTAGQVGKLLADRGVGSNIFDDGNVGHWTFLHIMESGRFYQRRAEAD